MSAGEVVAGAAEKRLQDLGAIANEFVALFAKLDAVQKSGPPDATDGSHELGKFTVFGGGADENQAGAFAVTVGLVGITTLGSVRMSKVEARSLIMALLSAGA